MIVVGCP